MMNSSRRRFLTSASLAPLAGRSLAFPDSDGSSLPDGSDTRGMIAPETQRAIDRGLAYLERSQYPDGSFGRHHYKGNVAITSLGALAMMAGGHQPGQGVYGKV